jgi:hypothetical protein
VHELVDPGAPSRREPAHGHDPLQTRPIHHVKRLGEVEFDEERRSSTLVGTLDDFQGIDYRVFSMYANMQHLYVCTYSSIYMP